MLRCLCRPRECHRSAATPKSSAAQSPGGSQNEDPAQRPKHTHQPADRVASYRPPLGSKAMPGSTDPGAQADGPRATASSPRERHDHATLTSAGVKRPSTSGITDYAEPDGRRGIRSCRGRACIAREAAVRTTSNTAARRAMPSARRAVQTCAGCRRKPKAPLEPSDDRTTC
jgi:hypothetical protein